MLRFEDYESAIPDLHWSGTQFEGTCPVCGKPAIIGHVFGKHQFDLFCRHCKRADLDEAVLKLIEPQAAPKNGHAPIIDEPPPRAREEPKQSVRAIHFPIKRTKEIMEMEPPTWQVEDFFPEQSLVEIFGQSNHGKSILTYDLALNIAKGSETWFGRKIVRHGPVVWINADGGLGIINRARAWMEAHGGELKHEVWTLMGSVRLNRADETAGFLSQLKHMEDRPVLVVLDTLSRCIPGVDENNQGEMTKVMDFLHRIKNELPASVLPLHHTNKSGEWDRGSSVIKCETDTQIRVTKDDKTNIFTVSSVKARDAGPFADFYFSLRPVGDSVVVQQEGAPPPETPQQIKAHKRDEAFEAIGAHPGISNQEIAEKIGVSKSTAERYTEELIELGLIVEAEIPGKTGRPRRGFICRPPELGLDDPD